MKTNHTLTNKPDPKAAQLKLDPRNAEVRRGGGASKEFLCTVLEGCIEIFLFSFSFVFLLFSPQEFQPQDHRPRGMSATPVTAMGGRERTQEKQEQMQLKLLDGGKA